LSLMAVNTSYPFCRPHTNFALAVGMLVVLNLHGDNLTYQQFDLRMAFP
jgi:hypothetical protein